MTKSLIAALAAAALYAAPALAQEKKELTDQQKRMQQCNADAKKQQFKDNDARQAFMSTCLKGGAAPMTQQEKMTYCNKQAGDKGMKGDERKAFMSKCLSG
jgi:hypothetical protein